MNTVPIVDGKNVNLYTNGLKRTTICGINNIVNTPTVTNGNINIQTNVNGKIVSQQFDERTGHYKTSLY